MKRTLALVEMGMVTFITFLGGFYNMSSPPADKGTRNGN